MKKEPKLLLLSLSKSAAKRSSGSNQPFLEALCRERFTQNCLVQQPRRREMEAKPFSRPFLKFSLFSSIQVQQGSAYLPLKAKEREKGSPPTCSSNVDTPTAPSLAQLQPQPHTFYPSKINPQRTEKWLRLRYITTLHNTRNTRVKTMVVKKLATSNDVYFRQLFLVVIFPCITLNLLTTAPKLLAAEGIYEKLTGTLSSLMAVDKSFKFL